MKMFTIIISFVLIILVILLGFQYFSNKKIRAEMSANLNLCGNDVQDLTKQNLSCETQLEKLYQAYGKCSDEFCLFVNDSEVLGFLTITGDTITEKGDFMGQEVECNTIQVREASDTPMYLLEERFKTNLKFTFNGEVPSELKNRKNIKLKTTFPNSPNFGPLPCPGPFVSIIAK